MLNWLLVGSAQLAVVVVCGEGWFCSTAGCAEGAYDGLSGGGLHASAVRGRMALACQPDGSWFEGRGGGGLCLLRARPCLVCWRGELVQQLGPFGAWLHAGGCKVTTSDAGYYIPCNHSTSWSCTLTSRMPAVADARRLMERTPSAPPRCPGRRLRPRQAAGRGLRCPVARAVHAVWCEPVGRHASLCRAGDGPATPVCHPPPEPFQTAWFDTRTSRYVCHPQGSLVSSKPPGQPVRRLASSGCDNCVKVGCGRVPLFVNCLD